MRFINWLEDNWIWLVVATVFFALVIGGVSFFMTDEKTDALNTVLNTPLSEVKFWHFIIGIYLVVIIGSPRNSSK